MHRQRKISHYSIIENCKDNVTLQLLLNTIFRECKKTIMRLTDNFNFGRTESCLCFFNVKYADERDMRLSIMRLSGIECILLFFDILIIISDPGRSWPPYTPGHQIYLTSKSLYVAFSPVAFWICLYLTGPSAWSSSVRPLNATRVRT